MELIVRFDDMLSTMMGQEAPDSAAFAALWVQMVDILAQDRPSISRETRAAALLRVSSCRAQVPVGRRRMVAAAIASYCQSAELVRLFASDRPSIAAPLLTQVRLSVRQWTEIIPGLPVFARALIRERRDLPAVIAAMLNSYGASDFALPPPANAADDAVGDKPINVNPAYDRSIPDLAERVRKYQEDKAKPVSKGQGAAPESIRQFWFETGADGIIRQVEGIAKEAVIGVDLSQLASTPFHGVDGLAVGAFRGRQPYKDAHLRLAGSGYAHGDWLISALPCFAPESGRFLGYRGLARRDDAGRGKALEQGARSSSDALRQFVHEMRTPLNGVCGYSEMILGQFQGPVAASYQRRALSILGDARTLRGIFDDLQLLGELQAPTTAKPSETDAVLVVRSALDWAAAHMGKPMAAFRLVEQAELPIFSCQRSLFEALVRRAALWLLSQAEGSTTIPVRLGLRGEMLALSFGEPDRMTPSVEKRSDPDPSHLPLGGDFVQRLLEKMARRLGGTCALNGRDLNIRLPTAERSDLSAEG